MAIRCLKDEHTENMPLVIAERLVEELRYSVGKAQFMVVIEESAFAGSSSTPSGYGVGQAVVTGLPCMVHGGTVSSPDDFPQGVSVAL